MAGWIKIEHNLPNKEEVFGIARRVGQTRAEIVGRLIVFWSWADANSIDGTNLRLTSEEVDDLVGLPGLAAAMRAEGWLDGRDGSLQLPNFQRHNGNSAKARALENEAKRLRRLSDNSSDIVSDNCPTKLPSKCPTTRPDQREPEIHGPCLDRVNAADVSELAARVFDKSGYSGNEGGNLWKAAAACHLGLVAESDLWDACAGARETANDPAAVFYTILKDRLAKRGECIKQILRRVKITPKLPKARPTPTE